MKGQHKTGTAFWWNRQSSELEAKEDKQEITGLASNKPSNSLTFGIPTSYPPSMKWYLTGKNGASLLLKDFCCTNPNEKILGYKEQFMFMTSSQLDLGMLPIAF